jgi:hypothetical protein
MNSLLDQSITRHFLSTVTDQGGKITAEYVWIGGTMQDLRSKSRTLEKVPKGPEVCSRRGLKRLSSVVTVSRRVEKPAARGKHM